MGWKHEETKDLIWEAIDAIKDGRTDDALIVLERAGRPKWHSSSSAATKYAEGKAGANAKAVIAFTAALAVPS